MRVVLWTTLFLAASPGLAGAQTSPIRNGPYVQQVSATTAEVRVELEAPGPATLELSGPARQQLSQGSSSFHPFRLTGLSPQTRYTYVVRAGGVSGPQGEFTTAPADDSAAPFTFIVYGDNRSSDAAHLAVIAALEKQPADLLIHTGDCVAAGGDPEDWHRFFQVEANLLRDHPVFACIGNHELYEDEAATAYLKYLGAADPGDAGPYRPYGSFRWGRARFFLLNAFQDWSKGELAWLDSELSKADTEPALTFRFVVVHHSPWSSGHHGNDTRMLAAHVPELLAKHNVDLILAGHDHIYERGESPPPSGAASGLKYVISGGGGAPLYPDISPRPSTRKAEASYHFLRFTVDKDAVHFVAQRADGTTIEECGFKKAVVAPGTVAPSESWDCDKQKPTAQAAPAGAAGTTPQGTRPASDLPDTSSTPSRCGCRVAGASPAGFGAWAVGLLAMGVAVLRRRALHRPRARGSSARA